MANEANNPNSSMETCKGPSEFQIQVRDSRKEKLGFHGQLLSGSNYKEIKELFRLAWPSVLSYFLYYMVNMISLFFAGQVGEVELAAGTLALSFISITGASLFIGLSSAVETLCSQAFGARNYLLVGVVLQRGIWILGITCILTWSLWFNTELILLLVHQKRNVARLTQDFVLICIPALIGNFLFILLQRYLQSQGIVKPILYVCAVSNGVQIGLNSLLVLVFKLGLRGVAFSWALTMCTLTLLLFAYMKVFKLHNKTWSGWTTESLSNWSQFLKLAVSGMVMLCIEWWSFEVGAFLTGTLGEAQLASFGILFNWAMFVYMIPLGLSVAAGVRVGIFLGAGNPLAVKKTIKVALGLTVSMGLIILSLFQGLGDISGRVFTSSSDVLAVYRRNIRIVSVQFFFDGVVGVCSGIIRGSGRQKIGVVINFVSYGVALSIGISLMFFVFNNSTGLWIGLLTGVLLQCCSYIFLLWRTDWDKQVELAQRRTVAKPVKGPAPENLLNGLQAENSVYKHKELILASWISKTSSLPYMNHIDDSQCRLALLSNVVTPLESNEHQQESDSQITADVKGNYSLTSKEKRALVLKRLIPLIISLMILAGAVALRFLVPLPSSHETSSVGNDTLSTNNTYNNLTTKLVT